MASRHPTPATNPAEEFDIADGLLPDDSRPTQYREVFGGMGDVFSLQSTHE
jgi:hypothetical protein